ncbi:MAG: anthranilate synthase component I, partial [Acidimicrobiales bacterium]
MSPGVAVPTTRPDRPGRDAFADLARRHRIVPVWREVMADTLTPVSAFMLAVGEAPGFLLESVEGGERWGRYSFVGRNPLATIVGRGQVVSADGPLELPAEVRARAAEGVLATVDALLSAYRAPVFADLPPLHGGLVGYLGYDVVREVEHLPNEPPDDLGVPDAVLHVIGQLCAFDHWRQRVVLVD